MRSPFLILVVGAVACTTPEKPRTPLPSEAEHHARAGLRALEKGDLDAAREHFEQSGAAGRNEPWGRAGLAAVALARGDEAQARVLIDGLRGDGLQPEQVAPFLVGVLGARSKAPVEPGPAAAAEAAPTKQASPGSAEDRALAELLRAGHFQGVVSRLAGAADLSVTRARMLGDAYYNLQQWEDAVATYRKVLSRKPGDEAVLQYMADASLRLERYDDAIRLYRFLADEHPEQAGWWKLIGDAAYAKEDFEIALAAYAKAADRGWEGAEVPQRIESIRKKLTDR